MKQTLQKNGEPGVARRIISYLAVTVLTAALVIGARQYVLGQEELARQLADTETIGRLEELDAINYAIRLMNNGKVNEARQELQTRLEDAMRLLQSELPLANPRMQLLATDLCSRVAKTEPGYSVYSMSSYPTPKPSARKVAEDVDEAMVKPTNAIVKSGI